MELPENLVNINTFPHHTGIYYEFWEHIKLTNTDWKLVTYVDLSQYESKFQTLMSSYKTTAQVCTTLQNKFSATELVHPCKQFDQSTLPYLFEIETNHDNIWSTIGQDTSTG